MAMQECEPVLEFLCRHSPNLRRFGMLFSPEHAHTERGPWNAHFLSLPFLVNFRIRLGLFAFSAQKHGISASAKWPKAWPDLCQFWRCAGGEDPLPVGSTIVFYYLFLFVLFFTH